MAKEHSYSVELEWTGNTGGGTNNYVDYSRSHEVSSQANNPILGSADPHFRGDSSYWNPEQLLIAAVANCHMLVYLAAASRKGIIVIDYTDNAHGTMVEDINGGHFTEITLNPRVVISHNSDKILAEELHRMAHEGCFIAASVNFPIYHKSTILVAEYPD